MLPGGFLGVDVFFVLSGYLITDLLVAQWHQHGRLRLGNFWARRARRLLPALATMLVVVTAATAIIEPSQLAALRPALLAAVTYSSNWWQALHHRSYFTRFGPPPPLQHLWSLAIEEQFYLVWPLLLAIIGPNRELVLVNTYEARSWEAADNRLIGTAAHRYPNVFLANWFATIEHCTSLLWPDEVHPQPSGARLYAHTVAAAVRNALSASVGVTPHRQPGGVVLTSGGGPATLMPCPPRSRIASPPCPMQPRTGPPRSATSRPGISSPRWCANWRRAA